MGKAPPGDEQRARATGRLLLAGLLMYAIAWFAPPYRQVIGIPAPSDNARWSQTYGQMPERAMQATVDAPEWLPGWAATQVAFHMLFDGFEARDEQASNRRLSGASCLSNLAMLAALLLLGSRGALTRVLGVLLIGSTVVNASWLYLPGGNPFALLRVGYFLWLLSFPLVGFGLLLRPGKADD